MYKQVQSFKRQGRSKKQIAASLGMDPKTVAKYYHMDEREFKSYRKRHMFREKLLEEYEEDILEVYEANEFKRLNMSAVYDYLEERHGSLPCNEQTLRNYINYLIQTDKLRLEERLRSYSKVPELPFGQQMQLDFGQHRCRSGLKLFIFAGVLSASRYKYVVFQGHPFTTRDVIDHLLDCFDFFGGMPEELVIDQDRLMVVSENAGDIIYTADFRYFIEEQELRMYVCRKDDPETKGKIENLIKYVKCNFFSIRDFKLLEEANSSVMRWLQRRANGKISQATKQIPAILVENERQHLRPVRNSIYRKGSLIGREERQVNEKAVISVNASSYQLPSKYRNKTVEVYITRHKLFVFDLYTGKEIVDYDLSLIPGQMVTKRDFRRENEKTLQELKDHVTGMFAGSRWKLFTALNFQAYPRYIRDQCVEAKRYFEDRDTDLFVLDRALEYCLENNTLSFAELNDTYVHFKREHERADLEMPAVDAGYQGSHEPLRVRARGLSVYKEIINSRGTINESL
jgi:transposase